VGVQALDAPAGAADAPERLRTGVGGGDGGLALGGVGTVRRRERDGVDIGLGRPHASVRLEPGDALVEGAVDEPVARRHRRAVARERRVADHRGRPVVGAHGHLELRPRLTAEELAHRGRVDVQVHVHFTFTFSPALARAIRRVYESPSTGISR
jgi:hypothetical protein